MQGASARRARRREIVGARGATNPVRLTEAEFIRLSEEPGTVVLDARSRQKFELLHIKGAVNLSFPDITVESLNRLLPDKGTRILIYCNNNFVNAEEPFPTKAPAASLNLSTYVALYIYGYRTPYAARQGWVSLTLRPRMNWAEVTALVTEAYRQVAAKRLLKLLDSETD